MPHPIPEVRVSYKDAGGKLREQAFKPSVHPLTEDDLKAAEFEVLQMACDWLGQFLPMWDTVIDPDKDVHDRGGEPEEQVE